MKLRVIKGLSHEFDRMKRVVGLVTMDMKFASLFRESMSKMGVKTIHTLSTDELPFSVDVVVTKKGELRGEISNRKILYLEDYRDLDELAEKVLEILKGVESYRSILIGIDPGKTIGVAFSVNYKIIRTLKYFHEEKMIEDVKAFIERHREAEEKIIVVGSTTTEGESSRLQKILTKRLGDIERLKIEFIDESRTTRGLVPREKNLSKDEYSAILLSLRRSRFKKGGSLCRYIN
ncbi:MAG: Holliday junction resolvase RuvX [Nitrososphaerota archaeon]